MRIFSLIYKKRKSSAYKLMFRNPVLPKNRGNPIAETNFAKIVWTSFRSKKLFFAFGLIHINIHINMLF